MMMTNNRILEEVLSRKNAGLQALRAIEPMHEPFQRLIEKLSAPVESQIVQRMVDELVKDLVFSERAEEFSTPIKFHLYNWYYDGSEPPQAYGSGGADILVEDFTDSLPVTSADNLGQWFNVGLEPGEYFYEGEGYIDLRIVLEPYLDVLCKKGSQYVAMDYNPADLSPYYQAYFLLYQVAEFELLYVMHLAMKKIDELGLLREKESMGFPFYLYANNQSRMNFLIYIINQ